MSARTDRAALLLAVSVSGAQVWNRVQSCGKVPPEASLVPPLDTLLGGKYRMLRVLGEGGMGTVYEAENVLTLKRAAIKRLHPHVLAREPGHRRLLHEARVSSRIRHGNVVDVYDVVADGDAICLVMELLIGEPLSARIARGGMVVHEFVALLLPAMRGVAEAHAVGVIHRDVKPENIFLASEPGQLRPVPKVIDFGISKLNGPGDAGQHTRSAVTMGTPKYMSYEALVSAQPVDGRADIYSFGVMLYEALTGRAPYEADSFGQQAVYFATTVPPRPSALRAQVPEGLDAVVWQAIARDRDDRFATMGQFIDALQPYAHPARYEAPLAAFQPPLRDALLFGVGPARTTAPVRETPQAVTVRAESAEAAPPPADRAPTRPRRTRLFVAAGLLAAGTLLAYLLSVGQAPTLPNRQVALSELGKAPKVEATQAAPLPAAGDLGVQPSTAPAQQPSPATESTQRSASVSGLRGTRRHSLTTHLQASQAKPDAPAPATSHESSPSSATPAGAAEDAVHRAGRIRNDQF